MNKSPNIAPLDEPSANMLAASEAYSEIAGALHDSMPQGREDRVAVGSGAVEGEPSLEFEISTQAKKRLRSLGSLSIKTFSPDIRFAPKPIDSIDVVLGRNGNLGFTYVDPHKQVSRWSLEKDGSIESKGDVSHDPMDVINSAAHVLAQSREAQDNTITPGDGSLQEQQAA